MSIEFSCGQCQSILRVPQEHAGKQARCPQCDFINTIPLATNTANEPPGQGEPKGQRPENQSTAYLSKTPATPGPSNPYDPPNASQGTTQWVEPHRGSIILVLGILSVVSNCCFLPGIIAWSMGSTDLSKIAAGKMDPSGEQLTRIGMILGIIGTCIGIGGILLTGLFGILSGILAG